MSFYLCIKDHLDEFYSIAMKGLTCNIYRAKDTFICLRVALLKYKYSCNIKPFDNKRYVVFILTCTLSQEGSLSQYIRATLMCILIWNKAHFYSFTLPLSNHIIVCCVTMWIHWKGRFKKSKSQHTMTFANMFNTWIFSYNIEVLYIDLSEIRLYPIANFKCSLFLVL